MRDISEVTNIIQSMLFQSFICVFYVLSDKLFTFFFFFLVFFPTAGKGRCENGHDSRQ